MRNLANTSAGLALAALLAGLLWAPADQTSAQALAGSSETGARAGWPARRAGSSQPAPYAGTGLPARMAGKASSKGALAAKASPVKKVRRGKKARRRALIRQTEPHPARAREIQEALRRQGYLNGPVSGKWDESTRAAMARYQKDQGFHPTGKPDALSLIKLGLGPKYENLIEAPAPPATSPPSPK